MWLQPFESQSIERCQLRSGLVSKVELYSKSMPNATKRRPLHSINHNSIEKTNWDDVMTMTLLEQRTCVNNCNGFMVASIGRHLNRRDSHVCDAMRCQTQRKKWNTTRKKAAEALFIRAQKVEMFTITFVLCINHLLVYSFRVYFGADDATVDGNCISCCLTSSLAYLLIRAGMPFCWLYFGNVHRPRRSAWSCSRGDFLLNTTHICQKADHSLVVLFVQ